MMVHPFLFATPHMLDVAKQNIARYEWANQVYLQLKADADKLAEMELPKFETAWWQEAKKKSWHEIYPEINHHTGFAVRPAIYAAFASALVYRLGGEKLYLEQAKRVLIHYTGYQFIFVHPDVGLNYAGWGIHALWVYDLLYDQFSVEERHRIDDFFDRWLKAIVENDEWWIRDGLGGKFNNHYTWHKLAVAAYGLFYGKFEWVKRAFDSEQGIRQLMEHGWLDDGLWFESALNYHYTALHGLMLLAWMLRNANYQIDLFTHQFANGRTLEQGFSAMVQELFPDLTVPQIGDTYGHTIYLPEEQSSDVAWTVYQKPLFGWLVSQRIRPASIYSLFCEAEPKAFEPPSVASRNFPEHGHVMLRSIEGKDYWNSNSWAAFLTYDLDSVHSHRDKLSLILFGRGKVLAQDVNALASVPHAFSAKVTSELNRSTISHNTLIVDRRDHAPIGEKLSLLEFKNLPEVKTATVADLKGLVYPGVKMQRTVAVAEDYVLDVFQVVSEETHLYGWLLHVTSDGNTASIEGEFKPIELPAQSPWCWLRNPRSFKQDGDWSAEWFLGDVRFRMTMLGAQGTEIILCDYPRDDQFELPPIPMLMVERKGKSAIFIAVYQAEKNVIPPIKVSASSDAYNTLRIKVSVKERVNEHLIAKIE
jgi:hypothetical protein